MLPDIARLMKDNPDLRVILRDFPVLSDASIDAATVAAGVRDQFKGDKFWEYHQRLLGMRGLIGKEQANELAEEMGADMPRPRARRAGATGQGGPRRILSSSAAFFRSKARRPMSSAMRWSTVRSAMTICRQSSTISGNAARLFVPDPVRAARYCADCRWNNRHPQASFVARSRLRKLEAKPLAKIPDDHSRSRPQRTQSQSARHARA